MNVCVVVTKAGVSYLGRVTENVELVGGGVRSLTVANPLQLIHVATPGGIADALRPVGGGMAMMPESVEFQMSDVLTHGPAKDDLARIFIQSVSGLQLVQ